MIDTNVFLDVFEQRSDFLDDSVKVLQLCEERKIRGIVSPKSICDLYYLFHSYSHDKEKSYEAIRKVLRITTVSSMSGVDIYKAFELKRNDFEDTVIALSAKASGCKGIITRNPKDFMDLGIDVYTPKEFLKKSY